MELHYYFCCLFNTKFVYICVAYGGEERYRRITPQTLAFFLQFSIYEKLDYLKNVNVELLLTHLLYPSQVMLIINKIDITLNRSLLYEWYGQHTHFYKNIVICNNEDL